MFLRTVQSTTAPPPSRADQGRVVVNHKAGWVRKPAPVPALGGAPASVPPPTSPFPVQGGECSCFTIKLFFPFHTNTSSLLGLCLIEV